MINQKSLLLGLLLSSSQAFAVIDLTPKNVEIQNDNAEVVTLINKGDHPEFVTISLSRLLNPGVPYEQEQLEPVGLARDPQLYASPFQLTLPPGQSKNITLKPLVAVAKERVYRLEVKPVTVLNARSNALIAGGVAVNLSFSALVRQLPQKQTSEIATSCNADGVTLTASGTVRYTVSNMKIDGVKVNDFNIYPDEPLFKRGRMIEIKENVICR